MVELLLSDSPCQDHVQQHSRVASAEPVAVTKLESVILMQPISDPTSSALSPSPSSSPGRHNSSSISIQHR
ncbi:hypothetical protein E2C01_077124 [Portunus trituberculatus]|uniref:Uncharacterized protein n=1 Tax=Portunus trituberculatus TaxID=210409 RepID=A0A5B7IKY5_PORTR|nr:hypothetical protein [Portunus trituberculatus]